MKWIILIAIALTFITAENGYGCDLEVHTDIGMHTCGNYLNGNSRAKMDLKEIVGPLGQAVTINERNHGMVESFRSGEGRMLFSG